MLICEKLSKNFCLFSLKDKRGRKFYKARNTINIISAPGLHCKPGFFQMKRVSIFIDGNNLYHGLKKIYGNSKNYMDFNFDKFTKFIAKDREIVSIFYYNAPLDISKDLEKYKSQQRFFDKIKRIPNFNLVLCKLAKRKIKKTGEFYYTIKEDDIHMAVDMVEGAADNTFDVAIVVSGDGDFVPAVKSVRKRGKIVENIYFKKSFSRNLKQNCDKALELTKEILGRFFD